MDQWEKLVYDPSQTYEVVKLITGCGRSWKLLRAYRGFILFFLLLFMLWNFYSILLSLDFPAEVIEKCDFILLNLIQNVHILSLAFNSKNLNKATKFFIEIFPIFNSYVKLEGKVASRQKNLKIINRKIKIFWSMLLLFIAGFLLGPPIANFILPQSGAQVRENGIDSRLPIPLYKPVDNYFFFFLGYLTISYFLLIEYGQGINMYEIYISSLIQLGDEILNLNDSISNLENRALGLMKQKKCKQRSIEESALIYPPYLNEEFQECLFQCIREDVVHHIQIIRCLKMINPYIGIIQLELLSVLPFLFAFSAFLLSTEGVPIYKIAENILLAIVEFSFLVNICLQIQDFINCSSETMTTIYSLPWYNYNKKVKQQLHIFQSSTLKPLMFRVAFFGFTMHCELLLNIIYSAFSYVNVMRNFTRKPT